MAGRRQPHQPPVPARSSVGHPPAPGVGRRKRPAGDAAPPVDAISGGLAVGGGEGEARPAATGGTALTKEEEAAKTAAAKMLVERHKRCVRRCGAR